MYKFACKIAFHIKIYYYAKKKCIIYIADCYVVIITSRFCLSTGRFWLKIQHWF